MTVTSRFVYPYSFYDFEVYSDNPLNQKHLRRSKYFLMDSWLSPKKRGRGAKFQNMRKRMYKITATSQFWYGPSSGPNRQEISKLINAGYVNDSWVFNDKRDADKAWVLLMLKYGA